MKTLIGCLALCLIALAAEREAWLSTVPAEQQAALAKRLDGYVKANHSQDWAKLFEFISDAARGGVDRSDFVPKMKAAHRRDFSNSPDLLEFQSVRTIKVDNSEYDVYGCAKAQREGREYNGVALVHAVFQHNDWFFSGWSFTEFPNEPCKALSDPKWEAPNPMEWNQPMEELRNPGGLPFHVDSPKK
jgi:hypothetical protein